MISGRDSGRVHGDVDFTVHMCDMDAVRTWLKAKECYDPGLDSMCLPCNSGGADFGVHACLEGALVSFCPFYFKDGTLYQRNAVSERFEGFDALFEATVDGFAEEDYIEVRRLPDGSSMGIVTLEACRAAKMASGRLKDVGDIAEIDRIGYDAARFAHVAAAFSKMRVRCVAHG